MIKTLATQKTTAREIIDGVPWYRICQQCGQKQDESRSVNLPCQRCNSGVVVWIPWPERRGI